MRDVIRSEEGTVLMVQEAPPITLVDYVFTVSVLPSEVNTSIASQTNRSRFSSIGRASQFGLHHRGVEKWGLMQ